MASNPALLQMQLRRNNDDMQEMLKGLDSWEDDIKKRDDLLKKQKPILKKSLPPIRGKTAKKASKETREKIGTNHEKSERIKSFDYNAWNKFDVEGACEESEEEEEEEGEEDVEASRREMAVLEKERGNQLFKEGKYEAAIEHYTRGVDLDPISAVLPANRAMALLKLQQYAAAERDCDLAIALDETYVKAWLRRATARIALHKLKFAIHDLEQVLTLEPNNKHAKTELGELNKIVVSEPPNQQTDKRHVHVVKRPVHLRSKEPLFRVQIEETGGELEPVEEKNRQTIEELPQKIDTQETICDLPTNSIQFQCHWKSLRSNSTKLLHYFKAIPPSQYPVVLRQSLESETFTDIIDILEKEYIEQGCSCYEELDWISKVQRFSVAIMFLSNKDKKKLMNIFEGLLTLKCDKASVLQLAKQYSISLSC